MDLDPFWPAGSTTIKRNRRNDQDEPTDGTGGSGSGSEMREQPGRRKPNPPIPIKQDGPVTRLSHSLEIAAGADIMEEVAAFAGRQQRSVCVLSGDGFIANPTLRHIQGRPEAVVTFSGQFQILSMTGLFVVPSPCRPGSVNLTLYVDGGRGQAVGGSVVGKLVAAGPVMVKTATWSCATDDHLPAAGDKPAKATADAPETSYNFQQDTPETSFNFQQDAPETSSSSTAELDQDNIYQFLLSDKQLMMDECLVFERTLSTLQELIKHAEWWVHKDGVADLLQDASDPVYCAEDLLDSLHYDELLEKSEGNNTIGFSFLEFPKMKEVKGKLDQLIRKMENLDLHGVRQLFMDESVSLEPNLLPAEPKIIGRHKELLELINFLGLPEIIGKRVQGGDHQGMVEGRPDNVSVLPITGTGGVGKTALVHAIFSEKRVRDHFDLLIWICVSDGFDEKKLIKKLIQSAAESEMKSDDLRYLQKILTNGIIRHSRRFLLVIDDVQEDICQEDFHKWKSFLAPLDCAKPGSMVLVTTRFLKVAEHVGTMKHSMLEGLPEGNLWRLFKMHAFGSDNSDINPVLASIGRSIVSRLNGSPLGAQIIGRLLSLKLDPIYWRNILESELWEVVPHQENEGEDKISICSALKLSYQYLPFHLKRCFSFCSMYPRNYEFDAGTLVDCWVAVGLVLPYGSMLALDVGHLYFQQLVNRSLFQKAPTSSGYVMHDLVYDMAQHTSRNECFVIKDRCDLSRIPPSVRHLSVLGNSGLESSDLESLHTYKTLRSIICSSIDSNILTTSVVETWFSDLVNIRMLRFISCQLKELPENVGNLVHLRYLDISACEFDKFPDSFWRLYNLEILDARNCKIQHVPNDIVKLVNLQRVKLKDDLIRHRGCVPRVGNLVFLQEMPYYAVGDEPGRTIHELKNMNHLRGILEISGLCGVTGMEQSTEAVLHKKVYLDTLILSWHESIRPEKHNSSQEMEVLEGLRPSSNIKHLEVKFYMGAGFHPSWLHEDVLSSLASLSISSCPNISTLFGQPSRTDGSSSSSTGSFTGFRSLTKLCITWCKRLTGLDNFLHPEHLPAIKVIRLSNCEDLVSLPTKSLGEFLHLENLEVSHCWSLNWEQGLTLPLSLKVLKLEACGEFSDSALSCLRGLVALTNLDLQFCPSIESICTQIWSSLVSLENLKIVCCQGLNSIGGSESIARIGNVDIRHCPKLKELEQPFFRGCYC
ncbi:hypothetical protein ACQ4PT_020152 [Festuca glaucescens]